MSLWAYGFRMDEGGHRALASPNPPQGSSSSMAQGPLYSDLPDQAKLNGGASALTLRLLLSSERGT